MNFVPPIPAGNILNSAFVSRDTKSAISWYTAYAENPLSCEAAIAVAEHCFEQHSRSAKDMLKLAIELDRPDGRMSLQCAKLAGKMGLMEEALECAVRATASKSTRGAAYVMLARLFVAIGEVDPGLRMLELAYDANTPEEEYAPAVADILYSAGRIPEALEWLRKNGAAIPVRERTTLIARCLCCDLNTLEEGVALLEDWLSDHPDDHDAYMVLTSGFLRAPGCSKRCISWCERGLRAFPGSGYLHFHRAWSLLASGEWQEGWTEYEWRWQIGKINYEGRFAQPLGVRDWVGAKRKKGDIIYVHGEQGFGDNFMFLKFLPLLRDHFKEIIVGVYDDLVDIVRDLKIADEVTVIGHPRPSFDAHMAIGSLPLALQVFSTNEVIALCKPSYRPPVRRLPPPCLDRPRIGFVWGGVPLGAEDARSIPNDQLAQFLSEANEVIFVLLQQGIRNFMVEQSIFERVEAIDFRQPPLSWSETAQILLQLDGLLTIDTGVAHLGGLLGIPTALVLPPTPDWRWLDPFEMPEYTSTCLWYPSMQLFRTNCESDYTSALRNACAYLKNYAQP